MAIGADFQVNKLFIPQVSFPEPEVQRVNDERNIGHLSSRTVEKELQEHSKRVDTSFCLSVIGGAAVLAASRLNPFTALASPLIMRAFSKKVGLEPMAQTAVYGVMAVFLGATAMGHKPMVMNSEEHDQLFFSSILGLGSTVFAAIDSGIEQYEEEQKMLEDILNPTA